MFMTTPFIAVCFTIWAAAMITFRMYIGIHTKAGYTKIVNIWFVGALAIGFAMSLWEDDYPQLAAMFYSFFLSSLSFMEVRHTSIFYKNRLVFALTGILIAGTVYTINLLGPS